MDALLGPVRRWWWRRGHTRFYRTDKGRQDAYALNAGSREAFDALVADLRSILRPGADDVALDLGGGNGRVSSAVFRGSRRLVVLDLCHPDGSVTAPFVMADMTTPPFRSGAFTTLFTYSTFPHLGSTTAALKMLAEWDRLLAPGGTLFIGDVPDRAGLGVALRRGVGRLPALNGFKYYIAVAMISMFSSRVLARHLEALGYEVSVLTQAPTRRFHRERFDLLARKALA
jgi:hypothetical protein